MEQSPHNSHPEDNNQPASHGTDFHFFVWVRIVGAIVLACALIWGVMKVIDFVHPSHNQQTAENQQPPEIIHPSGLNQNTADSGNASGNDALTHGAATPLADQPSGTENTSHGPSKSATADSSGTAKGPSEFNGPPGVAFVTALIEPMQHELNQRFWGWRPNDLIQFTDDVNEYQLGVLEVTRRAARVLTDNISRTGATAAINPHLERAMNAFMIRADRYLWPSAESQYKEAINNLNRYKEMLIKHETTFYTRTDNLVPLLKAMQELVGSCDENLVKSHEENGAPVSTFQADNYYYYAKGVASALLPLLEAIQHDFKQVLVTRNAEEIMEDAIKSCREASQLKPWLFVTESNLNGIFANHRANMAAHISHTRFYLGLMAESLSI